MQHVEVLNTLSWSKPLDLLDEINDVEKIRCFVVSPFELTAHFLYFSRYLESTNNCVQKKRAFDYPVFDQGWQPDRNTSFHNKT